MSPTRRVVIGAVVLVLGLGAQAVMEAAVALPRLPLRNRLSTIPYRLGSWEGTDVPMDPHVLKESGADDYLNREYIDARDPRRRLMLWINYSRLGYNLCHTPEVCLPSGGWTKFDSQEQHVAGIMLTRLSYSKAEMVQRLAFWYYIFGEGVVEHYIRSLPITSRSSHGRSTRGSSLTVEVFCPDETDPDGRALGDFVAALKPSLESLLPTPLDQYHIP